MGKGASNLPRKYCKKLLAYDVSENSHLLSLRNMLATEA